VPSHKYKMTTSRCAIKFQRKSGRVQEDLNMNTRQRAEESSDFIEVHCGVPSRERPYEIENSPLLRIKLTYTCFLCSVLHDDGDSRQRVSLVPRSLQVHHLWCTGGQRGVHPLDHNDGLRGHFHKTCNQEPTNQSTQISKPTMRLALRLN